MTFQTYANRAARQQVYILEIDIPQCTLTYGTSPCTAAIGVTGTDRCYNTFKTCQIRSVFAPATKTYRWSNVPIRDPSLFPCVPGITTIAHAPTLIQPGKGIGTRAQATVSISDGPFPDFGIDPYVGDRSYDVVRQGTFWGKWLARNQFYSNRVARLKYGFLNPDGSYDSTSFTTYTYIVDSIDWDTNSAGVIVSLLDVLKLASDEKAQCPAPSNMFLGTAILSTDPPGTLVTMTPAGIVASVFGADGSQGTMIIDNELIGYQVINTAIDEISLTVRAAYRTVTDDHALGNKVQLCAVFNNQNIAQVIYTLLVTYGNVPAGYINFSDWQAETLAWLSGVTIDAVIASVTGVTDLLNDLCAHGLCYIWWNERTAMVDFRAVRPGLPSEITALSDKNFLQAQSSVSTYSKDRISAAVVYWGIVDNTKNLSDSANYIGGIGIDDTDASGPNEYQVSATTFIYSRWIQDQDTAEIIANRIVNRYRDDLIQFKFQLDPRDAIPWTGDPITITSRYFQGVDGAPAVIDADIIQVQQVGEVFKYIALISNFQGIYGFWTDGSLGDYMSLTPQERNGNGFWTNTGGLNPDNSNGNTWS